jgi:hypothetical protein
MNEMNELTCSMTLSSRMQALVSDKSLVDSLEGTVIREYDSPAKQGSDENIRKPDEYL